MTRGALVFLALLAAAAAWFGRAALPGHLPADFTQVMDTYHLSVICERFGHYLRQGEFAAWLPEFGGGYPGHALSIYGFASPAAVLWAILPIELAYSWSALLHIAFGGTGLYAFLRSRGCELWGAVTGAVVFAISEYTLGRAGVGHLNQLWALAWAPWVLRAIVHAVEGRRGAVGRLAIWAGLALLAGHVQVWFYLAPALAAYAVLLCRDSEETAASLGRVAGGAVLSLGVAAVQWIPALEFASVSDRPIVPEGLFLQWSAPLHVLAAKVAPGLFGYRPLGTYWGAQPFEHELTGLAGAAALLLVLLGVARRGRARWFWAVIAVAGLFLALGAHTAVTHWLSRLPVIGWGRVPARAQVLTVLGGAVLAGHGVSDWTSGRIESRALLRAVLVAGACLVAGLIAVRVSPVWARPPDGAFTGIVLPAVGWSVAGAAAVALALLAARRSAPLRSLLPLATAFAMAVSALPPINAVRTDFLHVDWAARIPSELRDHRVHLADFRLPPVERQGLRTFRRMAHVDTRWRAALVGTESPQIDAWMNVGSVLGHPVRERGPPTELTETLWVERPPIPPIAARLFPSAVAALPDDQVARRLAAGHVALYVADTEPGPPASGAVIAVTETPTGSACRQEFEVTSETGGWLFVSERWYPGWTAEVNGEERPVVRANVAFRAVAVEPGRARVVFRFRSLSLRGGAVLSGLALLTSLFLGFRRRHAQYGAE